MLALEVKVAYYAAYDIATQVFYLILTTSQITKPLYSDIISVLCDKLPDNNSYNLASLNYSIDK
jgi:hypothetical protein